MTALPLIRPPIAAPPVAGPSAHPPTTAPHAADPSDDGRIRKAAQDFEAMAIGELLRPMFDTIDTSKGLFGGGSAEAAWKPMLIQEMARKIAAHGGLGLSGAVQGALLRMQEEKRK